MTVSPFPLATSAEIEALLDFYVEAGVDCALEDAPCDRFAESASARANLMASRQQSAAQDAARVTQPPAGAPLHPAFATGADSVEQTAQAARACAAAAETLEALRDALQAFDGCGLKATAKNLVFSDGAPHSRVMLVGEAPGRDEDLQGLPFVGRSGQLLDRMLHAIGLDRSKVYIANIVPWRPPGNRTPTPQEAAACRPFIERQIELCNPDVLVCLGGPSVQSLLNVKEGILRTRGKWFDYTLEGRSIRALATLHPAYLLRQPLQKRLAWRDFKELRKALEETVAP